MSDVVEQVPLHRATSERYLSYALSVITSRALPDVRDGLKPVQRRILYAMFNDMSLAANGRYRKCAAVVGEVMGKYHPHGDASIYEALVRMAQDFSLRAPLIDGQGNFGSLDGDPPAAPRYTECKLRPLAEELLSEIGKQTVDFRPNYDGQHQEPAILPAQLPQLLINGSEGIAVGMATKVPPHNLGEVVDAAVALIDDRGIGIRELMAHIRGPDFPTGGHVLASAEELAAIYETGQGTVKVRATWGVDKEGRRRQIVVDSIPYGQNKSKIVEHIGEEVRLKRLPQVVDVRDESTDVVRIVLELKADAKPEAVMAYLFKRTQLQGTWSVNLTALVPTVSADGTEIPVPARLDLKAMLVHWLDFRLETVRRRYRYDLTQLEERIHILDGFARVFEVLDEVLRIVRASDGKRDAADKLAQRFSFSERQLEAILELRLYRLAKLEIHAILEELGEKRAEADRIGKILSSEDKLWSEVRRELKELRKHYGDPRRTLIGQPVNALEYDEDAYIVKEDTYVVVTRDGWIKRQSSYSGIGKIRVRDGDEISWLYKANTRSTITFFTNLGAAYVIRVDGVPATAGYGEPLQANFGFSDGERVVGVVCNDPRHRVADPGPAPPPDDPPPPYGVAITVGGRGFLFPLKPHEEVSNRTGRRYARLNDGDQVFMVYPLPSSEHRICLASRGGRALVVPAGEMPVLKAAGKGVMAIDLHDGDEVMAYELSADPARGPVVVTSAGKQVEISEKEYGLSPRGGHGRIVLKRGSIDVWQRAPIVERGDDDLVARERNDAAADRPPADGQGELFGASAATEGMEE